MNYYYPPNLASQSKALWVLDAILKTDKNYKVLRDKTMDNNPGIFWGLGGNNFDLVKEYVHNNIPYYFTDMPYWNRWLGNNRDSCSWRVIPNALHCNWIKDYPSDRFKKLNVKVNDYRKTGNHILVCPSSSTIERFYNEPNWLSNTVNNLKQYTDRPIKIRHKPRANGTSGPAVAKFKFEDDVKNAWAVVSLVSIAGVEAACLGIPVFCHSSSPCAALGNIDLSIIETPNLSDRAHWLNTLAYYQYTENELKRGMHKVIYDSFLSQ
jgi:hypothetical protein